MHLGVPILNGVCDVCVMWFLAGTVLQAGVKKGKSMARKEREQETYIESRWVPLVKDIVEVESTIIIVSCEWLPLL